MFGYALLLFTFQTEFLTEFLKRIAIITTPEEPAATISDGLKSEQPDTTHPPGPSPRRLDLGFGRAPLSPDSGQRIRLRGGAGPWEGYLEVRGAREKPWGHVCDVSDSWTIQEANVICRTLGFIR